MTDTNLQELFEYLFALRISLQDSFENEFDIIRELKKYLIEIGLNPDILVNFYQNYGIDISEDVIQNVSTTDNQILNNMLGFMLSPQDFEQEYEPEIVPNDNSGSEFDDEEPEDELDDELDDEPEDNSGSQFSFSFTNSNGQQFNFTANDLNNIQIPPEISQSFSHQTFLNIINTLTLGNNPIPPPTFEDVSVTVDESELENLKHYTLEKNLDYDCSICMGHLVKDEKVTELKCSHIFHSDCIDTYLKQYNHKCPVCRKEVGKVKYNM